MTCKDCIHCEVCEIGIMNPKQVHNCKQFKDKFLFTELPFKVGQKVYFCYETDNGGLTIDEGKVESFSIDEIGLWFFARYKSGLTYWHPVIDPNYFLTRKEAEKKLQEWKE